MEDKIVDKYGEYYTCQVCKTTYHLSTMLRLLKIDVSDFKNPDKDFEVLTSCAIPQCPAHKKPIKLTQRNEPTAYEILKGLQDLYADYINLKKMEADFNELSLKNNNKHTEGN